MNNIKLSNKTDIQISYLSKSALNELNFKNANGSIKLLNILDKQVKQYLNSLDGNLRLLLSKNQLIKSREKVYLWHRSNQDYIYMNKELSVKYLNSDYDPSEFEELPIYESKRSKTIKSSNFNKILTEKTFEQERNKTVTSTTKNKGKLDMSFSEWLIQWNTLFDYQIRNDKSDKSGFQTIRRQLLTIKTKMGDDVSNFL